MASAHAPPLTGYYSVTGGEVNGTERGSRKTENAIIVPAILGSGGNDALVGDVCAFIVLLIVVLVLANGSQ